MITHADPAHRFQIYRRLSVRNRIVAVLRIGVPVLGALALAVLLGQIYLSSLTGRFGIGQISVNRDSVTVEAPEYAGMLEDGSFYRVRAADARAALETTDLIDLTDATLAVTRATGVTINADAHEARLDTTRQFVIIDGLANISDSTGTSGVIRQSVFDWAAQTLVSKGNVEIDYADGTDLEASGMIYDAQTQVWTFSDVTVTLPSTPGAEAP
jgi:lipopolysaccharide export system protein LptC